MKLLTGNPDGIARPLYSASEVRELDRIAIEVKGIAGISLMRRAGAACLHLIKSKWPDTRSISIFTGSGNNAGDGFVIAGLAAQQGIRCQVVYLKDPAKLAGDALLAFEWSRQFPISCISFDSSTEIEGEIIVDALLGTGSTGELRKEFHEAITLINARDLPVLAVDLPSGLNPDTGFVAGTAVKADVTVTLVGPKIGLFSGSGPEMAGLTYLDDLEIPEDVYAQVPAGASLMGLRDLGALLGRRARNSHKGDFGHLLVVGGDHGMAGAAIMAGDAAMRVGAGLVTLATRKEHFAAVISRRPEVMTVGVESRDQMAELLGKFTCCVVGPGLGQSAWSREMLMAAIEADVPMVLDADALNLLASLDRELDGQLHRNARKSWILTPHPGEASRLLACSTGDIQADRFAASRRLMEKYAANVVLKGAGSVVSTDEGLFVCPYGNPGMSVGGMGDVLSGVLGGLLAQGIEPAESLKLGVCLHSLSADQLAGKRGERGILATELLPILQKLVNPHNWQFS